MISKSKLTASPNDSPVHVLTPGSLSPSLQWAVYFIEMPSGAVSMSSILEVIAWIEEYIDDWFYFENRIDRVIGHIGPQLAIFFGFTVNQLSPV